MEVINPFSTLQTIGSFNKPIPIYGTLASATIIPSEVPSIGETFASTVGAVENFPFSTKQYNAFPLLFSAQNFKSVPNGVVKRISFEFANVAATFRQTGFIFSKSASIPPCIIMSSENCVKTNPLAPFSMAFFIAFVCVIDFPTTETNASVAFNAAAIISGGS